MSTSMSHSLSILREFELQRCNDLLHHDSWTRPSCFPQLNELKKINSNVFAYFQLPRNSVFFSFSLSLGITRNYRVSQGFSQNEQDDHVWVTFASFGANGILWAAKAVGNNWPGPEIKLSLKFSSSQMPDTHCRIPVSFVSLLFAALNRKVSLSLPTTIYEALSHNLTGGCKFMKGTVLGHIVIAFFCKPN